MTSRERLLSAIRRRPVDRVPVTLYEFHDLGGHWTEKEPTYRPLVEMQRRLGDTFVFVPTGTGLQGPPEIRTESSELAADGTVRRTTTITTDLGPLTSVSERRPGLATTWQIKRFVESPEDARRLLAVPAEFIPPDLGSIKDIERRLGNDGLLNFSLGDPIGHVAGSWDFEAFVLACYEDPGIVHELLQRASDYLTNAIDWINEHFTEVCIRLWGPEYSGAPLLNPAVFFDQLVTRYDRPLVERIRAGGNLSVLHCHGRLDDLLERIRDIGPNILEPLEVLPSTTADVTAADIKRRIGDNTCLAGGMQAVDLDSGDPSLVAARARHIMEEAGPEGLILLPTSTPITVPLPPAIATAYEAMFEAVHSWRS